MTIYGLVVIAGVLGGQPAATPTASTKLSWFSDYGRAMAAAQRDRQMLLVEFYNDGTDIAEDRLVEQLRTDARLRVLARRYVRVRVARSQEASVDGKQVRLINHAAFAELQGQAGLAIIDFKDPESAQYGYVVSIYPFNLPGAMAVEKLAVLLDLPAGTLTQRTLIFAVRTNPEHPASTNGRIYEPLVDEAQNQAAYQAQIQLQGHHHWESRFHRINGELPDGLLSQEVCAESWPGQGLIAAALECVHSWRQSPGHWSAVKSPHRFFGYDMKRGRNGIWYATGIFSVRH